MTAAMVHVIVHLPHAWHVTVWRHGWYAWREWHLTAHESRGAQRYTVAEVFGRTRGVVCGYLRTLGGQS